MSVTRDAGGGAQCVPPRKLRMGCPLEGQQWGQLGGGGGPKAWTVPPLSSVDDGTPPSSGTLSQTPACPSLTWTYGDQRGMGQVPFISQDKVGSRAGGSGATRRLSRALKPCFQGTGQSSPSTALPLKGPVLRAGLRWELSRSGHSRQLLLQAWEAFC